MSSYRLQALRSALVGAALRASPAFATVQNSCPAPCTRPPRYAFFARETDGHLDANGQTAHLVGALAKGSHKTVVRVDAMLTVQGGASFPNIMIWADLNGKHPSNTVDGAAAGCPTTHPFCTITATLWFDLDELEAAFPGWFVGQPLAIRVGGGSLTLAGVGNQYEASFSAQVVKNR